MLEKVPYQPKHEPSNEAARQYMPKFLYRNPDSQDVTIKEEFYGARRKLRIGILGAGISTLNFLHYLQEKIPAETVEVVVYEQNHDVGGVVSLSDVFEREPCTDWSTVAYLQVSWMQM